MIDTDDILGDSSVDGVVTDNYARPRGFIELNKLRETSSLDMIDILSVVIFNDDRSTALMAENGILYAYEIIVPDGNTLDLIEIDGLIGDVSETHIFYNHV